MISIILANLDSIVAMWFGAGADVGFSMVLQFFVISCRRFLGLSMRELLRAKSLGPTQLTLIKLRIEP
jgi:hypothetical protein